jgi:hypothetical protein
MKNMPRVQIAASAGMQEKIQVWQESFTNHRIRDAEDYERCVEYVRLNGARGVGAGCNAVSVFVDGNGACTGAKARVS